MPDLGLLLSTSGQNAARGGEFGRKTLFSHRGVVVEPWRLPKLRKQTERN